MLSEINQAKTNTVYHSHVKSKKIQQIGDITKRMQIHR